MERLTKRYKNTDSYMPAYDNGVYIQYMNKLGILEDVEEELGISLITLFKALKEGIYCNLGGKIEHILAPHLSWYYKEIYIFKIEDYGKTWALTEEELEKGE